MASSYHQLGRVTEDRGDLAAAEDWYRKSLEITEALGDRPSLALTYGQLGLMRLASGDLHEALNWTVRAVALFPGFPHPLTQKAPLILALLTAMLGLPALEESWRRQTGEPLPDAVRAALPALTKQARADFANLSACLTSPIPA
jgi:tetratricopeptide (TPR) repeat protein